MYNHKPAPPKEKLRATDGDDHDHDEEEEDDEQASTKQWYGFNIATSKSATLASLNRLSALSVFSAFLLPVCPPVCLPVYLPASFSLLSACF